MIPKEFASNNDVIPYRTRDSNGNDIIREVKIKKYPVHDASFVCPCCHKPNNAGVKVKDIVSANFTDWAFLGELVCERCAGLFSLYFYNYIIDPDGIRLYNVRELRDQLTADQKPPFLFVITTSQKKHLFYRAKWNYGGEKFAVNLEAETIYTTKERMAHLFGFVEALQTLGCGKERLKKGEIPFEVLRKTGWGALLKLRREMEASREIQIPLYCGQKNEMTEEEAICCINSTLKA